MGLNYPKDQGTEWFNLQKQVKNAFTSANSRVPYQKIAAGVLKVASSIEILAGAVFKFFYSTGGLGIAIGRFNAGVTPVEGFFVNRYNGQLAFSSYNRVSDGYCFTAIYDAAGNIIHSDDAGSGFGIARPWLEHTFYNTSELASPPAARQTTNTTDTTVVSAFPPIQHANMKIKVYVSNPGGGTCEVKVKDPGLGTTFTTFSSTGGYVDNTFSIPGFGTGTYNFGDEIQLDVTIRRSAGAGAVGITVLHLIGVQS